MTRRKITQVSDLDPFEFTWIDSRLKNVHTSWLTVLAVVIVLSVMIASAAEGAFGSTDDLQPWDDIRRAFGEKDLPPSAPEFPLMRDFTTWVLGAVVVAGVFLLHHQWKQMSCCISTLAKNGALIHRKTTKSTRLSRFLGVDKIVGTTPAADALGVFITGVNQGLKRHSKAITFALFVVSIILAALLVRGWKNSLFQVLVPSELNTSERDDWLEAAYTSWWASDANIAGWITYLVIAIFAIFMILSFQFVGLVSVYVLIGMYFLAEPSADWINRDGRYGWAPLARVYRTVIWANVLLGLTLSTVILALGIQNFGWISVLLVLYVMLMPIFSLTPWVTFKGTAQNAVKIRMEELDRVIAARGIDPEVDVDLMNPILSEIDRCNSALIRPLIMGKVSSFTYVTVIFLPIVLAIAQIYFPLRFGSAN